MSTASEELEKFDLLEFVKSRDEYRIVCLGATQSGKTYFCKSLLPRLQVNRKLKIFICDTKDEFSKARGNYIKEFSKLDLKNKSFIRKIMTFNLNGIKYDDPREISEFVCALAWNFPPSLAYVEEVVDAVSKHAFLPKSHRMLYKVLQQGAARKSNILVATQQTSQVNLALLRQSSDIFIFAIKPMECRTVEKALQLDTNCICFDLPTAKERKSGNIKDLYSFYHVESIADPIHYCKLEEKVRKKTVKKAPAKK